VAEAVQQARSGLDGEKPTFGFLFASPDRVLVDVLAAARDSTGAEIVGCTSAGEITERGLTHGGIALMLVVSDATIDARFATGLNADPADVARELCVNLPNVKTAAHAHDRRHLTTVLLTDGLAGTGELLVNELYERRVQVGRRSWAARLPTKDGLRRPWWGLPAVRAPMPPRHCTSLALPDGGSASTTAFDPPPSRCA
jgi:hypothetical protein